MIFPYGLIKKVRECENSHLTRLAQLVERTTFNRVAMGSNPIPGVWRGDVHGKLRDVCSISKSVVYFKNHSPRSSVG